ncbi:hypothetical protein [Albimonas pacifica]|uniref:Uncharacterized protein n=1 Tax=Albimonas pacifica TaxID=1114924 RepID=A0A1I3LK95_9RHOB|nr:hypothetical protein [Albimonas pacifica]SFI85143.1 hypothetical protein SAMN05216258_11070 [Albimonas pacifica]
MTRTYTPMDFRLGAVVLRRDFDGDERLGHVEGFGRNATGEAVISVRWEGGGVSMIHPNNVTLDPADWPAPWSEKKCLDKLAQRTREADEAASRARRSSLFGFRIFG